MRHTRTASRIVLVALVVLAARALAYALAPASPLAAKLEGKVGGPSFPLVAGVGLALGLGLAATIVWLASVGVRERHALAGEPGEAPRIRTRAVIGETALLFTVSSLVFAGLESYVHYRAGLGFHGPRCLVGPVHRDALPLLGALSLVGAAARLAGAHVLAWIRRKVRALRAALSRPRRRRVITPQPRARLALLPASHLLVGWRGARGPPTVAAAF